MPISGLVLITRPECATAPLLAILADHSAVTVGEPVDGRIPIVVDTPDRDSDREVWSWLQARPEVLDVAVAAIHLGTDESPEPVAPVARRPR